MEIVVKPDIISAAQWVADIIGNALRAKPAMVLGLAAGNTMEPVYARLVERHRSEGLDFSRCTTFNLDEYVGLARGDANSFSAYMRRHLFDKVNINPARAHVPDGKANNLEGECANYERLICESGGIDLQLLGIGRSGHLGFNEPPSELGSRARVVELSAVTLDQNRHLFERSEQMPHRALTMGLATILEARRCVLLATGASKAEIVAKAIDGTISEELPATALRRHVNCTVVLDKPAAALLENQPELKARP